MLLGKILITVWMESLAVDCRPQHSPSIIELGEVEVEGCMDMYFIFLGTKLLIMYQDSLF